MSVAVRIRHADLTAHAGVVVNEMGHPIGTSIFASHELEPVQDGRRFWIGITGWAMRPKAFAGDDILESIAVQIHEFDRVQLGKSDTVTVFIRFLIHENVALKLGMTLCVLFAELLVPGQPITVRRNAGDYIVQTVAVDIVSVHLRAAAGTERRRMPRPLRRRGATGLWPFPPPAPVEDI